jgi:radical SAM superfamily enzyme YgiQ (UPF0313 family)
MEQSTEMNYPSVADMAEEISQLSFEMGPIRPPSEGGSASLLIRATRNCPWNRCRFCYGRSYQRAKFQLRTPADIEKDIDTASKIASLIKTASWKLGNAGAVNETAAVALIRSKPELNHHAEFIHVFNWLYSGAKTAFLQDANSIIMPTGDLIEVLNYLKEIFPSLERITSYARSHTLTRKSLEELKAIRQAGLTRVHIGLETGDDELLTYIDKGVTADQHIEAGKKAKAAGFEVSEYVMPDLGGRAKSDQHARNTAKVLNAINPDFIRFRPFSPRLNTPLYEEYMKGGLQLSSPHERLKEVKTLVENLEVTSRLVFDHMLNPSYRVNGNIVPLFKQDYEGYKFPEEKDKLLELIEYGLGIDEHRFIKAEDFIGMPSL